MIDFDTGCTLKTKEFKMIYSHGRHQAKVERVAKTASEFETQKAAPSTCLHVT